MIAVIIDCFVCWAVRGLDLYSEDPEQETNGHVVDDKSMKELQPMVNRPQNSHYEDLLLKKLED